jgi:hypothetical protein
VCSSTPSQRVRRTFICRTSGSHPLWLRKNGMRRRSPPRFERAWLNGHYFGRQPARLSYVNISGYMITRSRVRRVMMQDYGSAP